MVLERDFVMVMLRRQHRDRLPLFYDEPNLAGSQTTVFLSLPVSLGHGVNDPFTPFRVTAEDPTWRHGGLDRGDTV